MAEQVLSTAAPRTTLVPLQTQATQISHAVLAAQPPRPTPAPPSADSQDAPHGAKLNPPPEDPEPTATAPADPV